MSSTCVLAVHFRLPPAPRRWYSDKQLAVLWNVSTSQVRLWRHRARHEGIPPQVDQVRLRRPTAYRRWIEISEDYAAVLEAVYVCKLRPPQR